MSASHRGRQARLSRQASVMQEMQKAQDKDSLDGRYARLMVRRDLLRCSVASDARKALTRVCY